MSTRPRRRRLVMSLVPVVLVLLACVGGPATGGLVANRSPRWACPSPTPKPFGAAGPVKGYQRCHCTTDPVTGGEHCDQCAIYYEAWEQEYGTLGGPPFPAPTPYGRTGTSFRLGERVEIAPLHVLVDAQAGDPVTQPGVAAGTQQLYRVTLTWTNPTSQAIPIDYGTQLHLSAVAGPGGRIRSDATWGSSATARELAGVRTLPTTIPVGTSTVVVPIIAPPGTPKTVALSLPAQLSPASTSSPTSAPPTASANPDLQADGASLVEIHWTAGELAGPACSDPGVLTSWASGPGDPVAVAAPLGADRVVQIALAQVGHPYVWGAKGPDTFDCSGLMSWSYAQIGIRIPQGTAGQWPGLAPVDRSQLQPGDLVYMDTNDPVIGEVTHVGMLVGDLNGDGEWDMVHAANPSLGVRIDYSIFRSSYYAHRILGFRTVRAAGGTP